MEPRPTNARREMDEDPMEGDELARDDSDCEEVRVPTASPDRAAAAAAAAAVEGADDDGATRASLADERDGDWICTRSRGPAEALAVSDCDSRLSADATLEIEGVPRRSAFAAGERRLSRVVARPDEAASWSSQSPGVSHSARNGGASLGIAPSATPSHFSLAAFRAGGDDDVRVRWFEPVAAFASAADGTIAAVRYLSAEIRRAAPGLQCAARLTIGDAVAVSVDRIPAAAVARGPSPPPARETGGSAVPYSVHAIDMRVDDGEMLVRLRRLARHSASVAASDERASEVAYLVPVVGEFLLISGARAVAAAVVPLPLGADDPSRAALAEYWHAKRRKPVAAAAALAERECDDCAVSPADRRGDDRIYRVRYRVHDSLSPSARDGASAEAVARSLPDGCAFEHELSAVPMAIVSRGAGAAGAQGAGAAARPLASEPAAAKKHHRHAHSHGDARRPPPPPPPPPPQRIAPAAKRQRGIPRAPRLDRVPQAQPPPPPRDRSTVHPIARFGGNRFAAFQ